MNEQLDVEQKEQLTGGGVCHLHFHEAFVSRDDLNRLNDVKRIVTVTESYQVLDKDDIIWADPTLGNLTVTLPPAVGQKEYTVTRSADTNTVTVEFSDGQNCFGQTSLDMVAFGAVLRFKAYLGNWILI